MFQGAIDPHTPIGQGWLRASHRKLDKKLSTPYRPYHSHDKEQPLKKGEVVELDIEIWPTSIVVPAGYRIGLSIRGKDYVYRRPERRQALELQERADRLRAVPARRSRDRPADVFGGITSLHFGRDKQPYLLLPVIPPRRGKSYERNYSHLTGDERRRGASPRTSLRAMIVSGLNARAMAPEARWEKTIHEAETIGEDTATHERSIAEHVLTGMLGAERPSLPRPRPSCARQGRADRRSGFSPVKTGPLASAASRWNRA